MDIANTSTAGSAASSVSNSGNSSGVSGASAGTSGTSSSREVESETRVTSADGTVTITITYTDGTKEVRIIPGDAVSLSKEAKRTQAVSSEEGGEQASLSSVTSE